MSFEGVKINKLNGGLGRTNPTDDNVMALAYAISAADLPAGASHNEPIELFTLKNAEDAGFNAAFDANNGYLVHHAISEFFRLAPDAVLHLVPVADNLTPKQVMELAAFQEAIRNMPKVKGIAIGGTATTVQSLAAMVEDIQAVIDDFAAEHRLIDFVLLQGNGEAVAITVATYNDLRTKVAPNVMVSIAQDPYIAALDAAYAKYADVGAVLGMAAARQVNENWGSVNISNKPSIKKGNKDYPLSEGSLWQSATLSDGTKETALSQAEKKSLTAKGYVFAGHYEGYGGIFLNSSPACVEAASDYAYMENTRVWNKAARLIRETLLPEVKGKVKKDSATGYIRTTTTSRWEGLVLKALERMEAADEISGKSCYIDPKQNPSENTPLVVKASVVADGIVHEFSVDLGLTNKL